MDGCCQSCKKDKAENICSHCNIALCSLCVYIEHNCFFVCVCGRSWCCNKHNILCEGFQGKVCDFCGIGLCQNCKVEKSFDIRTCDNCNTRICYQTDKHLQHHWCRFAYTFESPRGNRCPNCKVSFDM